MDATKLIEEAQEMAVRTLDPPLPPAVEALLTDLAAANLAANKRIVELEHERDAARAELARLTTPRPIAEAPRDGTWVLGLWLHIKGPVVPTAMRWLSGAWRDEQDEALGNMTHYLPLPEVKP